MRSLLLLAFALPSLAFASDAPADALAKPLPDGDVEVTAGVCEKDVPGWQAEILRIERAMSQAKTTYDKAPTAANETALETATEAYSDALIALSQIEAKCRTLLSQEGASGDETASKLQASQIPDQISLGGAQREWLLNRPLTSYLYAHPERMPKPDEILPENARGYHAEWKIDGGKLYLLHVTVLAKKAGAAYSSTIDVLPRLFPGVASPLADWYSGALVVQTFNADFTKTNYSIVAVKNGVAAAPIALTEDEFQRYRQRKFAAYKNTEAYRLRMSEFFSIDPDYSMIEIDRFLYNTDHERYLLVADDAARQERNP